MKCYEDLQELEKVVINCRLCPRLVDYRENVPCRPKYEQEIYWRKPVPGFGDPKARLFILGLAPAADGGNRTGRIFTGDPTGVFFMDVLHEAGFANHPYSHHRGDSLKLFDCYITASVKCVPPQNRPLASEFHNCSRYLYHEILLLKNIEAVLVLGSFAFHSYLFFVRHILKMEFPQLEFAHGLIHQEPDFPTLYASYHPSPQNTYTGRLTKPMLLEIFKKIKKGFIVDNTNPSKK